MKPTTETEETTTVAVPVADLELIATVLEAYGSDEALELTRSHIPKPKPRLVAVDLTGLDDEKLFDVAYLKMNQPDLLTLLEDVMVRVQMNSSQRSAVLIALKHDLGVTE